MPNRPHANGLAARRSRTQLRRRPDRRNRRRLLGRFMHKRIFAAIHVVAGLAVMMSLSDPGAAQAPATSPAPAPPDAGQADTTPPDTARAAPARTYPKSEHASGAGRDR